MGIRIIYGIIAVISLLLIAGYCNQIHRKKIWFILLYISVFIVNSGYFALSVSGTLEEALLANRIAYLGSVFLPLCMMIIIMDVCSIKQRKIVVGMLICISIAVFLVAASGGYLDLYYADVSITFVDGAAKLVKTYGPLHSVYYIYLFTYFAIMVAIILYALKKKKVFDIKHAVLLLCAVMGNIAIWFVEQMIDVDFEFLSISYIITELFLMFLYGMIQDHEKQPEMLQEYNMEAEPAFQALTTREMDVLRFIFEDRRRKEIAEELGVTEHTVKKHTAHIFTKLEVADRKELYKKYPIYRKN